MSKNEDKWVEALAKIAPPKLPIKLEAQEQDSTYLHVFRCDLCQKVRPDEDRREPLSNICRHCVEAVGFEV